MKEPSGTTLACLNWLNGRLVAIYRRVRFVMKGDGISFGYAEIKMTRDTQVVRVGKYYTIGDGIYAQE